MALSLADMNAMDFDTFVETFGNIIEHSALIAAALWTKRPFSSFQHVLDEIDSTIQELPISVRGGILRVHPDLAGRLADEGRLTSESQREQQAAGLTGMTQDEKLKMRSLNKMYRDKFGFPFVICARENKKDAILKGLESRLENSSELEIETGLKEVQKICKLRLGDILSHSSKL